MSEEAYESPSDSVKPEELEMKLPPWFDETLYNKYNMCRKNVEETREVCRLILERVYTPCLENVPEYFEHMARVMMDGMWAVNGGMEAGSLMYVTKNLNDVPGYVLTEAERIVLQTKLKEKLAGKHEDTVLYLSEYFPYVAFFLYGIKNSYVKIFKDSPLGDIQPKTNMEYNAPQPPEPWYRAILAFW
ncbi:hypothetical protein RR48_10026 [Papilio machaon]|uniref:Uncharacterized protein n=1 Tax=Papilio machaon TaxID=76193 RepID=A0A194RFA1_PAPMA|nr:hypothetical protein RR48_10026 [Papilio machaon]